MNCCCWCSLLSGCSPDTRTPLLLYSPHGRDQLTLLEREFERRRPDVDVRWLDMGSQEILDRLRFERVNPQADVWFGGPTTTVRARHPRLAARSRTGRRGRARWIAARVGPGDLYYPAYRTPAVIAFNARAVSRETAPHDWDEVLEPRAGPTRC